MKKTLALTMIVKNEIHNLPRLFKSAHGCFDQAYITDTGSTDGTIEYLKSEQAKIDLGCHVNIFHFYWVKDFSAARNWNLTAIEEDYWLWCDGDDTLGQPENFKAWRDNAMHGADVWFCPYFYALDANRNPIVKFIRERVFKTSLGLRFQDPVHEGVNAMGFVCTPVDSWQIVHERTEAEMIADKGRNLDILTNLKDPSIRMKFYLGKEYFDAGKYKESAETLIEAVKDPSMQLGDRILAYQFLVHSLLLEKRYVEAIAHGHIAINLDPIRAEFWCFMGDAYIAMKDYVKAVPFFRGALGCHNKGNGLTHEFTHGECYHDYPKTQLAKLYFHTGNFKAALDEIQDVNSDEARNMRATCHQIISDTDISQAQECEDIVITCPMPPAYPWDEEIYKSKGLGGSETAAIEMAKHLKSLTGRQVKIFQDREETFVSESGVEYIPLKWMHRYFKKWKPKLHVAWRHNVKLTNAYTAVWCHDLYFQDMRTPNYDVILALSQFHKDYLISHGAPAEKILITRNGIEPKRFEGLDFTKQYGKVVWSNSPDRGLEHAMRIMDIVRESIPGAELHCFYGLENLYKYGLAEKADMLKAMIAERPWVKYKGNVDQKTLAQEIASSEVWLYSASFVETFCISAIESICCKAWPVVTRYGALRDTLKEASEKGMADLVDLPPTEYSSYAKLVIDAIELKKYQDITLSPEGYSWENVSSEWKKMFGL